MKKTKHLLWLLLLTPLMVVGQTYSIDTGQVSFENQLRPCFIVRYDAPSKTVKQAWSHYFKKKYGIKAKGISFISNKDVISSEDVRIASISDKRMNQFARITDLAGGSELKYFMSFGYDFFIGPETYPSEFEVMKKILDDFSVNFLNDFYADESSALLKKIRNSEKSIRLKNREIEKNIKRSGSSSTAVTSALQAKNNAIRNDIDLERDKIRGYEDQIEVIKKKQSGILSNE